MPKKHHKVYAKPSQPVHPSLAGSSTARDGARRDATGTAIPSVNDLITRSREAHVPKISPNNLPAPRAPRSVHPSLRNVLDIPETPAPRPRKAVNARLRQRRVPGPPPPLSGFTIENGLGERSTARHDYWNPEVERTGSFFRPSLERLPGIDFPSRDSLVHLVLVKIAQQWSWHLAEDIGWLSVVPPHLRTLLLSYIANFWFDQTPVLRPRMFYFISGQGYDGEDVEEELGLSRLDLSSAIGSYISIKQFSSLIAEWNATRLGTGRSGVEDLPDSWEDEADAAAGGDGADDYMTVRDADHNIFDDPDSSDVKLTDDNVVEDQDHTDDSVHTRHSLPASAILRRPARSFASLTKLSLAKPAVSDWKGLLKASEHLSTLTHLSLAFWGIPTQTPRSLEHNTRVRHPQLPHVTLSWGGTDMYTVFDDDWSESANILKRLSKNLYCLQWLDLEGCPWVKALVYEDGPEWNASWRQITEVKLSMSDDKVRQVALQIRAIRREVHGRWIDFPSEDKSGSHVIR